MVSYPFGSIFGIGSKKKFLFDYLSKGLLTILDEKEG